MSNVDELLRELMDGSRATVSELKIRDERMQRKNTIKRLSKITREQNKKSKLLFPTELAIPFNPYTGKEDDTYNRDIKYRPLMAQSSLMKVLKKYCNEEGHEDAKQAFIDKAGLESWDTSNYDVLTKEDAQIFRRYRVPKIFTLPVIKISIPAITRSPYGRDYMVEVKRDEITGALIGDMPLPLQINKLQHDLCYQAVKQLEEDIKNHKEDLIEKDKKERIRKIYDEVVVSSDYPLNYTIAYEIPLDGSYQIDTNKAQISGLEDNDIFANLKLVKVTNEISNSLAKYVSGEYTAIDNYNDFWELDMSCPNEDDKLKLGKDTRYEKPMIRLLDCQGSADLMASFSKYLDNEKELEKIFMGSTYVSKFTPELEPILLDAMAEIISIDDKRFTASVVKANADIIQQIFADKADDLLADAGCGLIEEGDLDEKESEKLGKDMADAIRNIVEDDDVVISDDNSVNTEELQLDLEE